MKYDYLPRLKKLTNYDYSDQLTELINIFEKNDVEVHNVMATKDGEVCFSYYNEPYFEDSPHILHSLTKLFTNTAVAQANREGYIKLTDKVISFYEDSPELLPDNISENLRLMTIEDLITMRSGHDREISGSEWRPLKTSWVKAFFEEPVVHTPGEHYCYSSACSYMLSAIVQKTTGMTAHEYLENGILKKLGISAFDWEKSPEGINSGGNGISIRVEDMLKLALLYERNGVWKDQRLIEESWIEHAFGETNPKPLKPGQRGYHFHMHEYGNVYSPSGIFGQNAMIIKELDMVIVVYAAVVDWEVVPKLTEEYFAKPMIQKETNRLSRESNINKGMSSKFYNGTLLNNLKSTSSNVNFTSRKKSFFAEENIDNINEISFQKLDEESMVLYIEDHRGKHVVHLGIDRWLSSVTSLTGNYLHHQYQSDEAHIVGKCWWVSKNLLVAEIRFIGTAFCDYLTFEFKDNQVAFNRWVNLNTQSTERPEVIAYASSTVNGNCQ